MYSTPIHVLFFYITYSTPIQCTQLYSNVLHYCTLLLYNILLPNLLYCTVLYCTVLYFYTMYSTVYCTTLLNPAIIQCTLHFCTILSTRLFYCILYRLMLWWSMSLKVMTEEWTGHPSIQPCLWLSPALMTGRLNSGGWMTTRLDCKQT